MSGHRVLIFDSGSGGLSVANAIRQQMPGSELVYAADTAAFPYGSWMEVRLVRRILTVMRVMIDLVQPDCVVIGCNTASTLALDVLREEFRLPFVGTVPAIKPAAAQTETGVVGVLATPGTVKREYTKTLIHTYAYHCKVLLHGAPNLAALAEAKLAGKPVNEAALLDEIMPVFKAKGDTRTDVVVLGCTHYPLLKDELEKVAPWPVGWIDPSQAIARRTQSVLPDASGQASNQSAVAADTVIVTASMDEGMAGFLKHGFTKQQVVSIPV